MNSIFLNTRKIQSKMVDRIKNTVKNRIFTREKTEMNADGLLSRSDLIKRVSTLSSTTLSDFPSYFFETSFYSHSFLKEGTLEPFPTPFFSFTPNPLYITITQLVITSQFSLPLFHLLIYKLLSFFFSCYSTNISIYHH